MYIQLSYSESVTSEVKAQEHNALHYKAKLLNIPHIKLSRLGKF